MRRASCSLLPPLALIPRSAPSILRRRRPSSGRSALAACWFMPQDPSSRVEAPSYAVRCPLVAVGLAMSNPGRGASLPSPSKDGGEAAGAQSICTGLREALLGSSIQHSLGRPPLAGIFQAAYRSSGNKLLLSYLCFDES
uniref:Uncharacterized protein n=1 Tax=Oryza glumipatula TaxID=40148 RepID=A0A0E0A4Y9_9ORYZ